MQRHMEKAGVDSFAHTVALAKGELARMPEARALALGPGFWTTRLVSLANRTLRGAGKSERWTEVRLRDGDGFGSDRVWMLVSPAEGKTLEQLGIGRRVRPFLRFASVPFTLLAIALGVVAYRRQTAGTIVLAVAGYVAWFIANQVAARLSGTRPP